MIVSYIGFLGSSFEGFNLLKLEKIFDLLHLIEVGGWLVGGISLGPERNWKVCGICADAITTENHLILSHLLSPQIHNPLPLIWQCT